MGIEVDFEECFGGFMVTLRKVTPQVTPQVLELLGVLREEKGFASLLAVLGLRDRKSLRALYINPALAAGLIERTIPDKPNSRLQQYRLTAKGREVVKEER
jgi:hypothetical protein